MLFGMAFWFENFVCLVIAQSNAFFLHHGEGSIVGVEWEPFGVSSLISSAAA